MREVTDSFLLSFAGISATLLGTFTVGVFFYLDSPLHASREKSVAADLYMRSGARWVFVAYSLPLVVPMVMVGMGTGWGALSFIVLSAALFVATVDTSRRILGRGSMHIPRSLMLNEAVTTLMVVLLIAVPWIPGDWTPHRSALVPALMLAFLSGFTSTATLVMLVFDRANEEPAAVGEAELSDPVP